MPRFHGDKSPRAALNLWNACKHNAPKQAVAPTSVASDSAENTPDVAPSKATPATKPTRVHETRDLVTWWHWQNTSEKRELRPEEDRTVVRSPFFEVTVRSDTERAPKQQPFPYFSWPRMGRQKWGYSKDDGADDFDRNRCTCTWAHFLYSRDVWVEVTVLSDTDHPNIASELLLRPRNITETQGGYWVPEKSGKNTVKFKIPYSADGLRFSLEFAWETLNGYGL